MTKKEREFLERMALDPESRSSGRIGRSLENVPSRDIKMRGAYQGRSDIPVVGRAPAKTLKTGPDDRVLAYSHGEVDPDTIVHSKAQAQDADMERVARGPDKAMDALEGPGRYKGATSGASGGGGATSGARGANESFDDWVNRIFPSNYRPNAYVTPSHMGAFASRLTSADYPDVLKNQRLYEIFNHPNIRSVMRKGHKVGGYDVDRLNPKILDTDSISGGDKAYWLMKKMKSDGATPDYVDADTAAMPTEQPVKLPDTPDVSTPPARQRLDDEIGSFMLDAVQNARSNMDQFQARGGMFMFPDSARPQETPRRYDEDRNQMLQMMMMQNLGMYQPRYPAHWGTQRRRW